MFLSRLKLNTNLRRTQLAMASPNKFHGAIESAFEEKQERNLWRIDKLKGQYYLMILSKVKPNFDGLIEQFGYKGEVEEVKSYDYLLNRIDKDQVWRFRLVANPTRTIWKKGERGKIVAHTSTKYQLEWLNNKASQNGFSIFEASVMSSNWKIFKKHNDKSKVRVKEVTFEGVLHVDDVCLFKKALTEGIGRSKVYGMGMLTIVSL
jgi:CRISPR system Cascade subunit CasE